MIYSQDMLASGLSRMRVDAGHKQLAHFVLSAIWKIGEIEHLGEGCSDLVGNLNVWIPEDGIDPKQFIKYFVSSDAQVKCFVGLFLLPWFYLPFMLFCCFIFWGFFRFFCGFFFLFGAFLLFVLVVGFYFWGYLVFFWGVLWGFLFVFGWLVYFGSFFCFVLFFTSSIRLRQSYWSAGTIPNV